MTAHTYALRQTANGKFIDIVAAGAGPGSGYLIRIPIRSGFERKAASFALEVLDLLNKHLSLEK